jgi:hypothetical protein
MNELEHCLAILKVLQIAEVSYCLSGGGDSGTVETNGTQRERAPGSSRTRSQ